MRWIIRSVMALVLLAVLAVGAVFMIPAEKVAGIAVAKFNALTGRELTISGSVRPSFWPQLGVKTGPISISNADWSNEGPMVQAEGLEISLDMAALIGGTVKITGVQAINPKIVLERAKDGAENWVFGGDAGGTVSTATPGVGQPFTLDKGSIANGSLVFADHQAGSRYEIGSIDATVAIPTYTGAATLKMAAVMNGQSFDLAANIDAFQKFLDGGVVGSELHLTAGDADVAFNGRAGYSPLEAEGDLTADLGNLASVSALSGTAAPRLPAGFGAQGVKVSGAITLTPESSLHLRKGKLVLDDNALAVDADLTTTGAHPKLSAKISAGVLNLAGLAGGQGGGSSGGAKAGGWPKDAIDVSALGTMDAAVSLAAESLDLGMVKFGASQIVLTNDRARLVAELRKVAAYEGVISGQVVVNGRKGLSVGGDLSFAGMALQPLLADFGGYQRLVGTGDLRVKFLGSGGSVDAIMHSLEGSGSLALSNGEILGLDIAGMLRTMDTSYVGEGQKTIFDSMGGSFTMAGGVLHNEDLALKSPYITAAGLGDIGLGARNLEYRIKATALADDTGAGGLTAPLLIKGSWADPKFSLDLQSLADEKLAEEKAKLEAQLKAKQDELEAQANAKKAELEAQAKAKLESELGVVQQDGESLEDAAKRRVNEALDAQAQKALQQLLGGGN